jgi:hypothetical protein
MPFVSGAVSTAVTSVAPGTFASWAVVWPTTMMSELGQGNPALPICRSGGPVTSIVARRFVR